MAGVDPGYQLLACRYLREQLDKLTGELRGVRRNEDIEPVHQARVASRRMRAAFRMFGACLEGKQIAKWQKRVKTLTRGLGAARDKDVQSAFVAEFLAGLDKGDKRNGPGVRRLLLRLRQDREALQPAVMKTLDKLERGNALAEMHGELEKTLFMLRGLDAQVQSPYVRGQTAGHIRQKRDDLLARAGTLVDPQDRSGHHQLRIAAKRLRYTMEICNPTYGGQLAPFIKAAKKMQSLLGDIHDCDVWVDDVNAFMEQERLRAVEYYGHDRPFRPLQPGLVLLRDERKTHREQTFAELVAYWEKLNAEQLWEALEVTLGRQEPVEGSEEPQPPDEQSNGQEEENQEDRAAQ